MKPPFKLGWADYALIVLTCLMILFFFDRWKQPVEDWLKAITQGGRPAPEPIPHPEALQNWLERQNPATGRSAPDEPAPAPEALQQGRTLNEIFGITPPEPEESQ